MVILDPRLALLLLYGNVNVEYTGGMTDGKHVGEFVQIVDNYLVAYYDGNDVVVRAEGCVIGRIGYGVG